MKKLLIMGLILFGFNQNSQAWFGYSTETVEDDFEAIVPEKTSLEMRKYYKQNCKDHGNNLHPNLLKCASEVNKQNQKFSKKNKEDLYNLILSDIHRVIEKEPNYKHIFKLHTGKNL